MKLKRKLEKEYQKPRMTIKVKFRNKNCKECPQNKREDIVWEKGFQDGLEVGKSMAVTEVLKKYKKVELSNN